MDDIIRVKNGTIALGLIVSQGVKGDPADTASLAARITALEATGGTPGVDGAAGAAGAEVVVFGPVDDTSPAVAGDVYGPFLAPVAYTISNALNDDGTSKAVSAAIRGGVVAGDVNFDVELCSSGITGTWTSIFTTGKPKVAAGSATGSASAAPTTTAVPAGRGLRAKILAAPTAGGSLTRRTPGKVGDLATGAVSSFYIPLPASYAAGDLLVHRFFAATDTATWPSGWTPYGAPSPSGDPTAGSTYYYHVGTKIAASSESTTQAVLLGASSAAVGITSGFAAGALQSVAAPTVSGTTTATSAQTPSSVVTTVDGSYVIHDVMVRHANTVGTPGQAGTFSWSGSLPADTQSASNRAAGSPNFAIASTYELKATAGAVTRATASWTGAARSVATTLVVKPNAGASALGPELIVRLIPA